MKYADILKQHRKRSYMVAAVLGVALCILAALAVDPENPSELALFVGRLHPLVVHLPIGFLLLAAILEMLSRRPGLERVAATMPFVLGLGGVSAIFSVLAGYLLGASGGYGGPTVEWHERLGICVAIVSVLTFALWFVRQARPEPAVQRAYTGLLSLTVGLLLVVGHLGGTLTHGEGYLTEYAPAPLRYAMALLPGENREEQAFSRPGDAVVYRDLIHPILATHCISCHGPDKQKGDLRLDSPEAIQEGGDSGPVLVAGKASNSEIIKRIWLPADHDDVMPPKGRRPVTVAEAELLRWWIDAGASFDQTLADVDVPASVRPTIERITGPLNDGMPAILAVEVPPADPAQIEKARSVGLTVSPLSEGVAFLQAHATNVASTFGDEHVQALLPLADQITWLDLSGTQISDSALAVLARFPNLSELDLSRTNISDAGLRHLSDKKHLEYLNLYGTTVTNAGLAHLAGLQELRSLYLWQTRVTPDGLKRLQEQLPRLKASLGLDPADFDSTMQAYAAPAQQPVTQAP